MIEGLPPFLGNNEMEVYEKVLALDYGFSNFFRLGLRLGLRFR